MVQMYGQSGALTYLLTKLRRLDIHFESLESILAFKDKWRKDIENCTEEQRIQLLDEIQNQKDRVEEYSYDYEHKVTARKRVLLREKDTLDERIIKYSETTKNPLKAIYYFVRRKQTERRQEILENYFEEELHQPFTKLKEKIQVTKSEIVYKETNIGKIVEQRSRHYISDIQRIKSILDSHYSLISGVIGELTAIEELRKLSNEYYVINNFTQRFNPPIYNRKENDRIYSIQVDHLVIAPSGVFLIETKNWSKTSVENSDLFSPIKQIRRSSFAMFSLLNRNDLIKEIPLSKHHWGEKKIPTRNILLMVNEMPKEEFKFVKILSINRLRSYLTYFDQIFSDQETQAIFEYLV